MLAVEDSVMGLGQLVGLGKREHEIVREQGPGKGLDPTGLCRLWQ